MVLNKMNKEETVLPEKEQEKEQLRERERERELEISENREGKRGNWNTRKTCNESTSNRRKPATIDAP